MRNKILTPEIIGKYFLEDKIYYSDHSMDEMLAEELGEIIVDELVEGEPGVGADRDRGAVEEH